MALPVTPVVLPTDLIDQRNGMVDPALLTLCGIGNFKMHHLASRALRAMIAAYPPFTESATGTYRTYAQQVQLFNERYSPTPIAGRPTKVWAGKTYWQKPGVAMAAVPGTSNHGLGLAIDFAEELDGDPLLESVSAPFVDWLCTHAWEFGFSAETQSEAWHWRYVAGDQLPRSVVEFEYGPQIPQEDEMAKAIQVPGDPAIFAATSALTAVWMQAGVDVALAELGLVETQVGGGAFQVSRAALKGLELRGPLPNAGPTVANDFAKHTP